jgi:DHA2 family multidrug resistance protein
MDARLMVSIGFLATSLALYNMTRLDLNVSFGHIVMWRVFQVLGLSFIFIPISTLNYVGVPKGKNNQISSFSNFARNFGGSMGTALLTTFLVRTQQTHQSSLAANFIPGSVGYENFLAQTRNALMAAGQTATQAKAAATGYAYQQLLRQSSMLSYQNAFWVLSIVAAVLVPWPFIMRRPPKHKKPPEPTCHGTLDLAGSCQAAVILNLAGPDVRALAMEARIGELLQHKVGHVGTVMRKAPGGSASGRTR